MSETDHEYLAGEPQSPEIPVIGETSQYNVEINRHNGSGYDQLYPKVDPSRMDGQTSVSQGGSGSNTLTPQISSHKLRKIYSDISESPSEGGVANGEVYCGYGATKSMYIGNNSNTEKIGNIYIGVEGKAKRVENAYIGVEGKARLFYSLNPLPPVYGVSWAGTSSPAWTRTDASSSFGAPNPAVNNGNGSSPFDNISPWRDMVIVDDPVCGKCVKIPKFYFKWTQLSPGLKLQISMSPFVGSAVCPACMDRGDGHGERDYVLVGRYHSASSKKSVSGQMPWTNITRATARSGIHSLGTNVWQWDWATRVTIQMLYLVEFANWNSQEKIGYGCGNNSSAVAVGQTDAMTYHTGTSAASRTTYGYCQYRHIEGLWDNVWDWMDGCYYNASGMNVILNPANFSDSSGGVLINQGKPMMITNSYPSTLTVSNNTPWAIYPSASNGSDSTFVCDIWRFDVGSSVVLAGAYWDQSQYYGLFYVNHSIADYQHVNIGSRLLKLP